MCRLSGVLDAVSSIVSAASSRGGDDSPKVGTTNDGKGVELDAGPLSLSLDGNGLSVKVDGKEVAKVDKDQLTGSSDGQKPSSPSLDLHSQDTFESAPAPAPVAGLF